MAKRTQPRKYTEEHDALLIQNLDKPHPEIYRLFTAKFPRFNITPLVLRGRVNTLRKKIEGTTGRKKNKYTAQQDEWIRRNPEMKRPLLKDEFNRRFNTNVSLAALETHRNDLLNPRSNRLLTQEEENYILDNMEEKNQLLARRFNRSPREIANIKTDMRTRLGETDGRKPPLRGQNPVQQATQRIPHTPRTETRDERIHKAVAKMRAVLEELERALR